MPYEIEVTFYEEENLWRVFYFVQGIIAGTNNRLVQIKKDSGMIFVIGIF